MEESCTSRAGLLNLIWIRGLKFLVKLGFLLVVSTFQELSEILRPNSKSMGDWPVLSSRILIFLSNRQQIMNVWWLRVMDYLRGWKIRRYIAYINAQPRNGRKRTNQQYTNGISFQSSSWIELPSKVPITLQWYVFIC